MKYVPAVDGFRALCVLAVILRHWGRFNIGWVGVQGFFVLSGFLITAILVDLKRRAPERPAEYFSIFYWRRTTRIFPLYYAFLLLAAVVFVATNYPMRFGGEWPWLLSYVYNFLRVDQLLHAPAMIDTYYAPLWSLAVEEQFYIIWPLLIWLLPAKALTRVTVGVLLAGPLIRLVSLCILASISGEKIESPWTLNFLTTTHLDAFAAGGAIAIGLPLFTRARLGTLALSTLAIAVGGYLATLGVAAAFPADGDWIKLWGSMVMRFSWLNLGFAGLVIVLLARGPLDRLFGNPVLAHVGKISYGLYMLHYPVQFVVRPYISEEGAWLAGVPGYIVGLVLSTALLIAISELSFWTLETWFLRRKDWVNDYWNRTRPAEPLHATVQTEPAVLADATSAVLEVPSR